LEGDFIASGGTKNDPRGDLLLKESKSLCPTYGVPSKQPITNLFDQSLHVFGDSVADILLERIGIAKEDIWKYHANLE